MSDFANPLLGEWNGPLGAPPFALVRPEDFVPALKTAIVDHKQELSAIGENPAPASFDNTIAAMERSGEALGRVRRLFWTLASAHSIEPIRAIEAESSAILSSHGTDIINF